jgi:HNH endonuclease
MKAMTDHSAIHYFNREVSCAYLGEQYTVRDNGAVLKHSQANKRPRPTDNFWTFGKPNDKTGYMEIASVRIHRIIANAFHGEPPSKGHVVDHIDTNKKNNRPEHLRWVTRLENVLLNPITVRRIEFACGCSVEEFLAHPSKYRDRFPDPNYKWMCTVSTQEAHSSLDRMLAWAKSDKDPSGGSLGAWIFNRTAFKTQQVELIKAKTVNAVQKNWNTPSEFPCCPQIYGKDPIKKYAENLRPGSVFCKIAFYSSVVSKHATSEDYQNIHVISISDSPKPWAIAKITYENDVFVPTSIGTYFKQDGADKYYCLAQGLEWTGGETFDDLT